MRDVGSESYPVLSTQYCSPILRSSSLRPSSHRILHHQRRPIGQHRPHGASPCCITGQPSRAAGDQWRNLAREAFELRAIRIGDCDPQHDLAGGVVDRAVRHARAAAEQLHMPPRGKLIDACAAARISPPHKRAPWRCNLRRRRRAARWSYNRPHTRAKPCTCQSPARRERRSPQRDRRRGRRPSRS